VIENEQTDYMVQQSATIDIFFSFSVPYFVTAAKVATNVDLNSTLLLWLQSF